LKKFLFLACSITLLFATNVWAQSYCASSNCEWGESDSAEAFHYSLTNETDGVLHSNWPVRTWSLEILDGDKFDDLMYNIYYYKNFVANRVLEICEANREEWGETDMYTCASARNYIRNTWMHKFTGSTKDEELTDTFWDVDEDNWFSYEYFQSKAIDYVQTGNKRVYIVRDFYHEGRTVEGRGIEMDDLVMVVDMDEQTITFITSELFD
jgi:hypothetical protein